MSVRLLSPSVSCLKNLKQPSEIWRKNCHNVYEVVIDDYDDDDDDYEDVVDDLLSLSISRPSSFACFNFLSIALLIFCNKENDDDFDDNHNDDNLAGHGHEYLNLNKDEDDALDDGIGWLG